MWNQRVNDDQKKNKTLSLPADIKGQNMYVKCLFQSRGVSTSKTIPVDFKAGQTFYTNDIVRTVLMYFNHLQVHLLKRESKKNPRLKLNLIDIIRLITTLAVNTIKT